jgi:hypothetical protein
VVSPVSEPLPALQLPGAVPDAEARQRFRAIAAAVIAACLLLGAVGWWSYVRVSESLREIRASNLDASLESDVRLLQGWIDEKKRDAERWASVPAVRQEALRLVELAASGAPPERICGSAAHRALLAEIVPYAAFEEATAVNLMRPDGTLIASQVAANCGRTVRDVEFLRRMAPAFAGRTVFVRPWPESERIGGAAGEPSLVWIETPVRDANGEVVAALGFGRRAADRFARLLATAQQDSTREAYMFGPRGLMLSALRYEPELRAAGRLREGEEALLRMEVREPGGELTRLAREAIEGLRVGGTEGAQGVVLEPYRNYRGAEVIGAWRWLPAKEMAVAIEIEAAEAHAPLRHLQRAFGILFAVLMAALLAALAASLWAARMRLREQRRMGQYTLEREIGEGGLSHVYLARHTHLKRPTAVKVLKRHLASDEVVARFEREVQLCSQLTHPNTIEIYDYGRTRDGTFYYAMEYLRGITLEDLVRREGALPFARAVHLLLQACGSLREAHERGLVHRDVKPHNLMLCVRGGVHDVLKLLDFGLVKEVRGAHTHDITQHARVLGTPLYMAPERLRNPADADARSDIYALGAVAHFLVAGRALFEAQTDHDLVYQVLNAEPPSLAARVPRVPPVLDSMVQRCLAKDRDARPATIAEVEAVLAELARAHPWTEDDARAWWAARPALGD